MWKFAFAAVVILVGAGLVSAAQVPCSVNTGAFYETTFTTLANGCTIGPLVFWNFDANPHGAFAAGSGTGPLTDADLLITPVTDVNGFGFNMTASPSWMAFSGGRRDYELPFEIGCSGPNGTLGNACLTDIFLSITGSATGSGLDRLTETYCLGGISPPPTAPCPPPSGGPPTQDILLINPGGPGTASQRDVFSAVQRISTSKDMEANALAGGSATITSVSNRFSTTTPPPPVPEPATLAPVALGLVAAGYLSYRQRKKRLRYECDERKTSQAV